MPERAVPAVFRDRAHLRGEGGQPTGERAVCDCRWPAARGQQHRQYRTVHVVERVAGFADKRLLIPRDPGQDADVEHQPGHRYQVTALLPGQQREADAGRGKLVLAREPDDSLGQPAEGHLALGPFERARARQTSTYAVG